MAPMASPAQSCSGAKQVTMVAANAAEISEMVSIRSPSLGTGIVIQRRACRWSKALVRHGADARLALAAVLGLPAEDIRVRDRAVWGVSWEGPMASCLAKCCP